MIKVKWIKVGDVIEVDDKKAKLKSIGEDFRYATLYTFKREDGSKFYWGHREVYEYVMDRHIRKLENLLSDEKQRADELEKRWSELVDVLKKKYEYYKVRADDKSFGPIEQHKWENAKHEMLMILMTMAELQEDNNA